MKTSVNINGRKLEAVQWKGTPNGDCSSVVEVYNFLTGENIKGASQAKTEGDFFYLEYPNGIPTLIIKTLIGDVVANHGDWIINFSDNKFLVISKIIWDQIEVSTNKTRSVLVELHQERQRQDLKFGKQDHLPIEWIAIIGEEFGEASKEALEHHFEYANKDGFPPTIQQQLTRLEYLREELVQLAAVTVNAIESLDRNQLKE
ncbi:hypothetical protein [Mesoflavibacter sp. CH_XMU1404-2]|uniref:hypothetical protein n=1 Tax=Mesoflavibacter sp. CH_XMU1404-2 TaxID=3107766 RepID=UPI00300BF8F3